MFPKLNFVGSFGIAISLVITLPVMAWDLGDSDENGFRFMYEESLEGGYGNNFWGKADRSDDRKDRRVNIFGDGKTVDLSGALRLNCEDVPSSTWEDVSNFGEQVASQNLSTILPERVLKNAGELFC